MKNLKVFLCLVAVFVVSIGINVSADALAGYAPWSSRIDVVLPIHKTDEAGKGLEGAIFTLKDFNNSISYSSSDVKDGDYLIEKDVRTEDSLDRIINALPSNYKDVITGIKSWEDVQKLKDRDDMYADVNSSNAYVSFYIPLKLEESVVPAGYQKQDFVVVGSVTFRFSRKQSVEYNREDIEARSEYYEDFYDNGVIVRANLVVEESPIFSYYAPVIPGFFEYDSAKDYISILTKANKEVVSKDYDEDEYMEVFSKLLEDEEYNTEDVKCPEVAPRPRPKRENFEDIQFSQKIESSCYIGENELLREDFEARFDDIVENCYCVIQLKNKKENIVVNPQTASTLGIISLITLGSIGFITAKKLRKNS